jgi:hypothetical protein
MQRTRHSQNGASPLISVLGVYLGSARSPTRCVGDSVQSSSAVDSTFSRRSGSSSWQPAESTARVDNTAGLGGRLRSRAGRISISAGVQVRDEVLGPHSMRRALRRRHSSVRGCLVDVVMSQLLNSLGDSGTGLDDLLAIPAEPCVPLVFVGAYHGVGYLFSSPARACLKKPWDVLDSERTTEWSSPNLGRGDAWRGG